MLRKIWARLGERERAATPAPPGPARAGASAAAPVDIEAFKRLAVDEAIRHLGLVIPGAGPAIAAMFDDLPHLSPRGIATAHRKKGEQLSVKEKKALGLRSNAFLGREAHAELTEAGRRDPLAAHETVLLRALFSVLRARMVNNSLAAGFERFQYRGVNADCPFCSRSGVMVAAAEVSLLPDPACRCPTANYGLLLDPGALEDLA